MPVRWNERRNGREWDKSKKKKKKEGERKERRKRERRWIVTRNARTTLPWSWGQLTVQTTTTDATINFDGPHHPPPPSPPLPLLSTLFFFTLRCDVFTTLHIQRTFLSNPSSIDRSTFRLRLPSNVWEMWMMDVFDCYHHCGNRWRDTAKVEKKILFCFSVSSHCYGPRYEYRRKRIAMGTGTRLIAKIELLM